MYWAWVIVLYAVRGAAPFDRLDVSLRGVISGYLAGGMAGGAVVGLLWPIAKVRIGAYLTATIAAGFALAGLIIAMEGMPQHWGADTWTVLTVMALGLGISLGGSLWKAASSVSSSSSLPDHTSKA
jgi:hypothetical protein